VDTVLLDKTGTLTFGTPQISDVVSADGFPERQIIAAAAIAERKSEHPLAKAIIARAGELAIPVVEPDQFAYTPGEGVSADYRGEEIIVGSRTLLRERGIKMNLPVNGHGADGVSQAYVARGGQLLGTIRIADILRPEAKSAVAAMREMGLNTVLLSGDAQEVTTSVGRSLGVDDAVGDSCQIRRPNGSASFAQRIGKLRWSALGRNPTDSQRQTSQKPT
jgi:P-type E1-E2 ATPase